MNLKNFYHQELHIGEFTTSRGQSWCIFGENHSGIDRFIDLLSGKLTRYRADILDLPQRPGFVTFRAQQELFEEEIHNDDSDFLNRTDPGTLVRQFLPDHKDHFRLLQTFNMIDCLDLGYRQLSSGQARKLLLLRELTGGTTTLVLQNPYDGLDAESCCELNQALMHLPERGIEVLVSVNALCDIPAWTSHLAFIENGRLACAGLQNTVLPKIDRNMVANHTHHDVIRSLFLQSPAESKHQREELVFLRNGFAEYGEKKLFSGLNLTIESGDHTLVTGPNGCGKSTLLDIITGDNPKCYANELRIFGKKRGTGESIWEIKKHMGIVSPSLHREHRLPGSALQVVLSGLYDSIGLYQKAGSIEIKKARQWLTWLDFSEKADIPFRRLSFAEQRLVLIARALIKRPKLLILDEPTQGLDDDNRNTILDLLEEIAARNLSTILFVSHRKDEHRPFFRQQIGLDSLSI
ncbi:MAG: ATP-binding cassette domain-containing protein [Proteobacteria bacterium]|nr:ATP-binding cassette domain-containing protein [Pseudomonadota bacterium]